MGTLHPFLRRWRLWHFGRQIRRAWDPRRIANSMRGGWSRIRGGNLSPGRIARSVAIGVFIGCSPFFGLHSLLCVALCLPLRADPLIAYVASNISLPPLIPLLLSSEIQVGSWLLRGEGAALSWSSSAELDWRELSASLLVGSACVATLAAALSFGISWWLAARWQRRAQSAQR